MAPPPRAPTGTEADLHPATAARGRERAELVRRLFAGIAPRYDLVNHLASLGLDVSWRRRAVKALGLAPGQWCLDACCGTGDLSLAVAGAGARVVGVDFCRPMLDHARAKAAAAPRADAVSLAEGDALRLPVATASMDGACVAFGVRNLADPVAGLRELARCVRPGGRVVVLEFSQPWPGPFRWLARWYCDVVVPWLGDRITGQQEYRYLPETMRRWLAPAELAQAFADAGLTDVRWQRLSAGIVALHVGTVPVRGEETSC